MKRLKKIAIISLMAVVLVSCQDPHKDVPQDVSETFEAMYKGASQIEWEQDDGYYKVEFKYDGIEREAWYNLNGIWLMTESDIPYSKLPQIIKDDIKSRYPDWKIDDIDFIERKDMTSFYVIEIEKGDFEKNLYYHEDGTFIKETIDDDHNFPNYHEDFPEITAAVYSIYPNARILDIDIEYSKIEVELIFENTYWEMILDKSYNWIESEREIEWSEVPAVVKAAFAETGHAFNLSEDEVEQIVRPLEGDGRLVLYHIELDREPHDIHLYFTDKGILWE